MRPIASGLSPNTQKEDVLKALSLLVSPWSYIYGESVKTLEQWFRQFFNVSYAISFSSGRGALYAILKGLNVGKGDEVIVQAFTCVVVVNPVLSLGATPVYVDITKNLTLDPVDLQKKITKNTKAIIVVHTFGAPSDMQEILRIAKDTPVIEDCAHTIGGMYEKKKLGVLGKAALFSFGRDKAFSSVFGGMTITNDEELGKKLRTFQKQTSAPSVGWVLQQLMHPVVFSLVLPLYDFFSIGKIILRMCQKLNIVSFPVESEEKKGKTAQVHIRKLPNALGELALLQLRKLKRYNDRREYIVGEYLKKINAQVYQTPVEKASPLLRFPVFFKEREGLIAYAKKYDIYFGKWYSEVIDPKGTDLEAVGYRKGSCKIAEELSKTVINLPTYPTMNEKDIEKVIIVLNNYVQYK